MAVLASQARRTAPREQRPVRGTLGRPRELSGQLVAQFDRPGDTDGL
jgi:hypothetical protein